MEYTQKSNQINNKKIAVQLGSIADLDLTEKYPNANISRQKKYLSMAEDLKRDKVDCIVMDYLPAKEIVNKNNQLKILDGYLFSDTYGIAVKKGNTKLVEEINKVLANLEKDGKIDQYVINHSN